MTIRLFEKKCYQVFDTLNHHQVNMNTILKNEIERYFPKAIDKDHPLENEVEIFDNPQWGETLFNIKYSYKFTERMIKHYPEVMI